MSTPSMGSRQRAVERGLIIAQANIVDGWMEIERMLNLDERTNNWVLASYRLSDSDGWIEASEATRKQILATAQQLLADVPDMYPEIALNDAFPDSGYRAAVLLHEASPGTLSPLLGGPQWQYWLPSFAKSASGTNRPELLRVFAADAYQHQPHAAIETLTSTLNNPVDLRIKETLLASFDPIWDDAIADALATASSDPTLPEDAQRLVLAALLRHQDPRGVELAAQIREQQSGSRRAINAGRQVLLYGNEDAVADWLKWFGTDRDFARAVMLETTTSEIGSSFFASHLSSNLVQQLYLLLADLFPPDCDPELPSGNAVADDPRIRVGWMRDRLLRELAGRGTWESVDTLESIAELRPDLALPKSLHFEALKTALQNTWEPIDPIRSVLSIVQDDQMRLVRNVDQLFDLVIESLSRLQKDLIESSAAADLWSEWGHPLKYRPKRELALSDYVKRHLDRDLARYLVAANREVENRPGNETDILVQCFVPGKVGESPQRLAVVVEVKGIWNDGLLTAMETQLANRYLHEHETSRGIYLVGWYKCDAWDSADSASTKFARQTLGGLREILRKQAADLTTGDRRIEAVVLDAALRST